MKTYNLYYLNTLFYRYNSLLEQNNICRLSFSNNHYFRDHPTLANPLSQLGLTNPFTFESTCGNYDFRRWKNTTLSSRPGKLGIRTKYNFSFPEGNPTNDLLFLSLPGHNSEIPVFDLNFFKLITTCKGKVDTDNEIKDGSSNFTLHLLEAPLLNQECYSRASFFTFLKSREKNQIIVVKNNLVGLDSWHRKIDIEDYNRNSNNFEYLYKLFEYPSYSNYNKEQDRIAELASDAIKDNKQQHFNSRWS